MAGLSGKKARVKVCTTLGGVYAIVAGFKSASLELDGAMVDDSEFGVDWNQRILGVNDWKITASGFLRPGDTLGQVVIRNSLLNGTDLFVEYLPDNGVTPNIGMKGQVICTKFTADASHDGGQNLSVELQGDGAPVAL
jgi:predicted secreted protein